MSKTVSIKDPPSSLKYVKKPMIKSTLSSSAMNSQSNHSNFDNSPLFSYNLGDSSRSSSSSKLVPNSNAYQAQSNHSSAAFYANSSVDDSTGAALAVLNCASSLTSFTLSDSPPPICNQEKNDPNMLEKLEFKTTVGTGTFGRVICGKFR